MIVDSLSIFIYDTATVERGNKHGYDLMFEKAFLLPIKGILDAIGWELEKRNKVSKFFKKRPE